MILFVLETKDFVDQLFEALNSKEYLKHASEPTTKSAPVQEVKSDTVLAVKPDRHKDPSDSKKPRVNICFYFLDRYKFRSRNKTYRSQIKLYCARRKPYRSKSTPNCATGEVACFRVCNKK